MGNQRKRKNTHSSRIDFAKLRTDSLGQIENVLETLLPRGRKDGREWVALNPTRHDRNLGSFRINIETGLWADFATSDRGGDIISLIAYVDGSGQCEAAKKLKAMLGGDHE